MIEIVSDIAHANGTCRGLVKAVEAGRTIHSDTINLDSARSRTKFARDTAEKVGPAEAVAESVTVIDAMLIAHADTLRARDEAKDEPEILEPATPDENGPKFTLDKNGYPVGPQIVCSPEPLRIAEKILRDEFLNPRDAVKLRRYRAEWLEHDGSVYRFRTDEELRAELYGIIDRLYVPEIDKKEKTPTGQVVKLVARSTLLKETEGALTACGTMVSGAMPQWLDGRQGPKPADVVGFRNGLLDASQIGRTDRVQLMPHTPEWFSAVVCPFDFDPSATCPLWLRTLDAIYGDAESIALLQEYFGYLLVACNRYEKFLMLMGKPGAGKGTVIEALAAMLGDQIGYTSFAKLASRFGLHPLMGKLAAVLPDAHIGRNTDDRAALEILKSITGDDEQSVDRKGVDELARVKMLIRFLIAVNELPRLPDEAGALKRRTLLLYHGNSFAGNEDTTLKARIRQEAPGIAVWALQGLYRLREMGGFTEPARSRAMLEEFERATSPVKTFLHERCELDAAHYIPKADLYNAWAEWCKERGDKPGNSPQFGQALINATPEISAGRRGVRGAQFTTYERVQLCS